MMLYSDYVAIIDSISEKETFTREDMCDILDFISLKVGFACDFLECDDTDLVVSSFHLKKIFDDLMIRFGPRSADE